MFAAQVNTTDSSDVANQMFVRDNADVGDDSAGAFAYLYEMVLAISGEQCSETEAPGDWFNLATEEGQQTLDDANGLKTAINSGISARERHINGKGQDSELNLMYPGGGYSENQIAQLTARQGQVEPLRSHSAHPFAALAIASSQRSQNPLQPAGLDSNHSQTTNSHSGLNTSPLAEWMDAHALARSSHHCAMYCRLGMEAGGLATEDRPRSGDAGDYGPFLMRHGAQVVPQDSYIPQVGDVAVFNKTVQHPSGHIEMFDGNNWVSDFMQHSFSPYRDASSTPPFTIYRLS